MSVSYRLSAATCTCMLCDGITVISYPSTSTVSAMEHQRSKVVKSLFCTLTKSLHRTHGILTHFVIATVKLSRLSFSQLES